MMILVVVVVVNVKYTLGGGVYSTLRFAIAHKHKYVSLLHLKNLFILSSLHF